MARITTQEQQEKHFQKKQMTFMTVDIVAAMRIQHEPGQDGADSSATVVNRRYSKR